MGGYGSTRWNYYSKKETADDCRVLSIFDLKQKGVIKPETRHLGSWIWSNAHTGEQRATIGYELNTLVSLPYFRIYYTITTRDGEKHEYDYQIRLQTTPCRFGGVRWWFICPFSVNGRYCGRRVGKLYLSPGGRYFACRHCNDLTYRSSQENDKRINVLKRLGPVAILQGMNNGEIDLLRGLKALPGDYWRR